MGFASVTSAPLVRSSFHAAGSEQADTLNVKTIAEATVVLRRLL